MTCKISVTPRVLKKSMMSPETCNYVSRLQNSAPSGKLYWGLVAELCEKKGCIIGKSHIIHFDDGRYSAWPGDSLPSWIDNDLATSTLKAIYDDTPLPKFSDMVASHPSVAFNLVFLPGNLVWAQPLDIMKAADELQNIHPVEPNLWLLGFFLSDNAGSAHQAFEAYMTAKDSQDLWQGYYGGFNAVGRELERIDTPPERIFEVGDPVFPLPEASGAG